MTGAWDERELPLGMTAGSGEGERGRDVVVLFAVQQQYWTAYSVGYGVEGGGTHAVAWKGPQGGRLRASIERLASTGFLPAPAYGGEEQRAMACVVGRT